MVKNAFRKNIFREIRLSLGRYLAIMSIVALGVGFFAGLQITQKAIITTGDDYVKTHNMHDYKLQSTIGLNAEDVEAFSALDGVTNAIGTYTHDVYSSLDGESKTVLRLHSISDLINKLTLVSGRLPEKTGECVVDSLLYSSDVIGKTIVFSDDNAEIKDTLTRAEYTVVGTARSVNYLNIERGTTSLGGGTVSGFAYLLTEDFNMDYYTEIYLDMDVSGEIYSEAYKEQIDKYTNSITSTLSERARVRYNSIIEAIPEAQRPYVNIAEPKTYVLTRNDNVGYSCFENDAQVVRGIAKVFPIFFFLVSALVCGTTMTRMISEQRTQIGTLKALGYSNGAILWKYTLYSGSSALIGGILGYFVGTWLFPFTIWTAYSILYGFADLVFVFDLPLAIISIVASLLCSVGVTFAVCRKELLDMPSELMRPKSPKAGRRIFLERIPFIWKRLNFLRKVSLRNIFRYKKRLFMMLLGVGGCTALLLTGFGIRDSIGDLVEYQFDEISKYDYTVLFSSSQTPDMRENFNEKFSSDIASSVFVSQQSVKVNTNSGIKNVNLIATDDQNISNFFDLHTDKKEHVAYPKGNEIVLSEKIAYEMGVNIGDDVTLILDDAGTETATFKLSGICKNYVYNYAYTTSLGYENASSKTAEYKYAYCRAVENADVHEGGSHLLTGDGVLNVSITKDMRERVSNMMESLNLVVWLVIVSAAALAFIVLINLSNINITERQREIATIKVLGFYPSETASYVFRENLLLSFMGAIVGMPLGILLHRFVMSQIKVDIISLDTIITFKSFLFAFLLTMLFTEFVDLIMRRKLHKIKMADSLKSVE